MYALFIGLTLSITNFLHSLLSPYSFNCILSFGFKVFISLFTRFSIFFFYGSPFLLSFIFSIIFGILLGSIYIFIGIHYNLLLYWKLLYP